MVKRVMEVLKIMSIIDEVKKLHIDSVTGDCYTGVDPGIDGTLETLIMLIKSSDLSKTSKIKLIGEKRLD